MGKTELAKTLAEFLFGDDDALIALDMSEYMEKHTVSRLVGSPPGYVGYEEGGQLTEAVRRKPFSVVLFDEIEKAHPDVFNTLLQILEEGRLTDSQGRSVDFRNTVLIMTSNLGTADLRKANVGFTKNDEAVSYERMKEKVNDALKQHFRPEFLNRIDEVIVFHELSKPEVVQIVDLMIRRVTTQLESQGLGLELTPDVKLFLAERGYDPSLGARPLRRAIQRMVEDPLSEHILHKQFHAGEIVVVDVEDDPDGRPATARSCSVRWRASSRRRWSWPRLALPSSTRQGGSRRGVLRGALVALVLLILLTGCRLDVDVATTVAEDGSGTVVVTVQADDELLAAAPGLVADLRLDDLTAAGWTVDGPVSAAGDGTRLVLTKPFASPEQANLVLAEVGAPLQVALAQAREFALVRTTVDGRGDRRRPRRLRRRRAGAGAGRAPCRSPGGSRPSSSRRASA